MLSFSEICCPLIRQLACGEDIENCKKQVFLEGEEYEWPRKYRVWLLNK